MRRSTAQSKSGAPKRVRALSAAAAALLILAVFVVWISRGFDSSERLARAPANLGSAENGVAGNAQIPGAAAGAQDSASLSARGPFLRGAVSDENGRAIAGALIDVHISAPVLSGANGSYEIDLGALAVRPFVVTCKHATCDARWSEKIDTSGDRDLQLDFVLTIGKLYSVVIVDVAGVPIEGACVRLHRKSRPSSDSQLFTKSDGKVSFANMEDGAFDLLVLLIEAYEPWLERDLELAALPAVVTLVRSATLEIHVEAVGGAEPPREVEVRFDGGYETQSYHFSQETWSAVHHLYGRRPVECQVRVAAPGYVSSASQRVQLDFERVAVLEFRLVARPNLTVRVVDALDQPIPAASVRLFDSELGRAGKEFFSAETDAAGLARVSVGASEESVLVVAAADFATSFVTPAIATSENEVRAVQLNRLSSIELELIDASGAPTDGVEVEYLGEEKPVPLGTKDREARTKWVVAGHCRFDGLGAGFYTFELKRMNVRLGALTVQLAAAEHKFVSHTLARATTVSGSVTVNRAPLAFSVISLTGSRGDSAQTMTDASGLFSVTMRSDSGARRYSIRSRDLSNHGRLNLILDSTASGDRVALAFETARLRLRVLDPAAQPMAKLRGSLKSADGASCSFETDADGAWQAELPHGTYRLHEWHLPTTTRRINGFYRDEVVAPHDAIVLTRDLEHAFRFEVAIPLEIEIVDPDGLPMSGKVETAVGVVVGEELSTLYPAAGLNRWAWPATARMGVAFAGKYPPQVFHVTHPDAARAQRVVMTHGGVLRVPSTPASEGVTLEVSALDGAFIHVRTWRLEAPHAEWTLVPGRYRVTATLRDGTPFERTVTVVAGATVIVE